MTKPHKPHDHSYKNLFSHAEMVEDQLRGFVPQEWVEELDFATLEKMPGSYVSDDLREREDDIVWRVRWQREWIYVYLLLEFQSSEDTFMALRMLVYVGLLYHRVDQTSDLTTTLPRHRLIRHYQLTGCPNYVIKSF